MKYVCTPLSGYLFSLSLLNTGHIPLILRGNFFLGSSVFLLPHRLDSMMPVDADHPDGDEDGKNSNAHATKTIPYREEVGKYTG